MDYSLDHAKTIFDLLEDINGYAIPLLLSLIFPLFWYFLKKVFGINEEYEKAKAVSSSDSFVQKWYDLFSQWIKLKGDRLDKLVFYGCIGLFISGIGLLKYGEIKQETMRQQACSLQKYFASQILIDAPDTTISQLGISEDQLAAILYYYPNDFVRVDTTIYFVDSTYKAQYYSLVEPLIEMSLDNEFTKDSLVTLNELFHNKNSVGNLLKIELVLKYLGTQKGKYLLEQDTIKNLVYLKQKPTQKPL